VAGWLVLELLCLEVRAFSSLMLLDDEGECLHAVELIIECGALPTRRYGGRVARRGRKDDRGRGDAGG